MSEAQLRTRTTVRAVFWTFLAFSPYLIAGAVTAVAGDPILLMNP